LRLDGVGRDGIVVRGMLKVLIHQNMWRKGFKGEGVYRLKSLFTKTREDKPSTSKAGGSKKGR
jgi:hypothetical protein